MKKRTKYLLSSLLLGNLFFTGCSSKSEESATSHIEGTTVITQVYGDGQKVAAVAIEYDTDIDADSLSTDDFTIEDHTITDIYTNSEATTTDQVTEGNYVILELSTDYINSSYAAEMDDKDEDSDNGDSHGDEDRPADLGTDSSEISASDSGGTMSGQTIAADSELSNQLEVSLEQTGEVKTSDGDSYSANSQVIETDYNDNINLGVDDFEQNTYTESDDSDSSLNYNLYITENYDENTAYPIVLFMPDATATSDTDTVKTLTQGLGAITWTTDESQESNPSFVVAPQYTSDGNNDVENTMAILTELTEKYNIDESRIYVTGQSAGAIRAIQMMIEYPDYFAAAMLVAGQADDSYTDQLAELANQNIWMIASTGDEKALPGMTAIEEAVEGADTSVTDGSWSATLSEEEQNEKVAEMISNNTSINFTQLSDVVPSDITSSAVTEHLNTWRVAYSISGIRDWIFTRTNAD